MPARPSRDLDPAPPAPALQIPQAAFDVVPAELADDHVIDRIRHRVVVKRWSLAWLKQDGAPIGNDARDSVPDADVLPVIGETPRKIRIVVEDDHARFAAWIARDDAADTALAPLQVTDPHGSASTLWLEPGSSLVAGERVGGLRRIQLVDELLAAEGWAPARGIGNVWVVPAQDRSVTSMNPADLPTWSPPRDQRPLIRIDGGAALLAAPSAGARVLATIKASELTVSLIGKGKAFTEIEAYRPYVHLRGFVDTAKILGPIDDFVLHGHGSGHGFGMSHAVKHEIPAGTCLYDQTDGDVIGVTLEPESRLGGRLGEDGWAMVYIDSPWSVASMYVKNLGTDPAQPPRWDSCTEPSHRR